MWMSSTCRLDAAQAVYRAARHMSKPTRAVMGAAQRVMLYLLRTAPLGLTFGGAGTDGVLQAMHMPNLAGPKSPVHVDCIASSCLSLLHHWQSTIDAVECAVAASRSTSRASQASATV